MDEHSKQQIRLISGNTFSFLRYFFVFVILLTLLFFVQENNLLPELENKLVTTFSTGTAVVFLPLVLLSGVTFIFFLLSLISDLTRDTKPENSFMYAVTFLLILVFLPLYGIYRLIIKPLISGFKNSGIEMNFIMQTAIGIVFLLFSIFYFTTDWTYAVTQSGTLIGQRLGIVAELVPIAGTGSMYPTFPKGESKDPQEQSKELVATPGMLPYPTGFSVLGFHYGGYELKRGDIVAFSNNKTKEATVKKYGEEAGLVKRLIGLPGDTIEIRDGILYLNNHPQKESYVAKARSTFGGDSLADCKSLTIPEGKLFVLGDNRTASNDSRFDVGLIDYADVDHVLPYPSQLGVVDKLWHDPTNDLSDSAKIKVDRAEFLRLLNEQRKKRNAPALTYNSKLNISSQKRGEKMIEFNDFSLEGAKSNYKLSNAIGDAGYSNIVYGEFYVQGYFEAADLVENLAEFPKTIEFLAKKEYQDIGFSEVTGNVNGCPTHVIVFHLGGYVPPDYEQSDIDGWKKSLTNLQTIQPGWAELKNSGKFYEENKADVDRLNDLIQMQIEEISGIITTMEANQWLSEKQKQFVENQEANFEEVNGLIKSLNEKSQQIKR